MKEAGPPLAPATLQPPALLRVQNERMWDYKGKGKAKDMSEASSFNRSLASSSTSVAPYAVPSAPHARQQHQIQLTGTSSRKVGLLGIPLSDSEDDDYDNECAESILSSESLEANPPVSPVITPAPPAPPAPTYSRGGSTRSGPSTRGGERQSEGTAFVSEQNFRDIVDDLTLQNQQLRAKLKRFESAKVPSKMKDERLFEVRFFQGLPKPRRREIEHFLTDYVQTYSASGSLRDSAATFMTRAFPGPEEPSTSGRDQGDSISSIGRSLRSSEKDALARATLKADADAAEAAGSLRGSRGSASGSGSQSGSRSAKSREQRRIREDGVPAYDPTRIHEPLGTAPLTSASPTVDPPSLLRRPTDIFPPDRDVLAAPSFSGVEPLSTTGTGHDMRISDPSSRKRKRLGSILPHDVPIPKDKQRRPHSTRTSSTNGSVTSHDPDTLENTIVQMIECLFLESLPPDSDDETPTSPPGNPLQSEPYPLPARSSSNTQYLRTILASEEYRHVGGWVYLNIVATFAALHRLSATIGTIRHALRTKSELIEVSADGSKIRWRGPSRKPPKKALEAQVEVLEECENELEVIREQEVQAEVDRGRRSRSASSSEPATDSIFDEQHSRPNEVRHNSSTFATSTAPTSLNPTNSKTGSNSKNGSEWQTGGSSSNGTRSAGRGDRIQVLGYNPTPSHAGLSARGIPLNNSSLRNSVEEVGSPARREETTEALGTAVDTRELKRHQYTPLFARRAESQMSVSEDSPDSVSEGASAESDDHLPPRKRRKGYEGGVVYFANDLFCSDLAGDFEVRAKLKLALDSASSSSIALGDSSTRDAMETDEADSVSRSASDLKAMEEDVSETHKQEEGLSLLVPHSFGIPEEEEYTPLEDIESLPLSPEFHPHDAYLYAPEPALRLSAMSDAVASDHFTIHIKYFHRRDPAAFPSPVTLSPLSPRRTFPRSSIFAVSTLFPRDYSPSLFCVVPRPLLVESKTLHHHPSVFSRPPRVLMSLSSDASDSESDSGETVSSVRRRARDSSAPSNDERRRRRRFKNSVIRGQRFDSAHTGGGGGGDYLMSLALPLNRWAPVTKRSTPSVERLSSSRAGTGSGEPSESLIFLD